MNARRIIKTIRNFSSNEEDIEKLLVKAFIMQYPILQIWESNIFRFWETEVVANAEDNLTIDFLSTLPNMSIENLIECFELLVSMMKKRKKVLHIHLVKLKIKSLIVYFLKITFPKSLIRLVDAVLF